MILEKALELLGNPSEVAKAAKKHGFKLHNSTVRQWIKSEAISKANEIMLATILKHEAEALKNKADLALNAANEILKTGERNDNTI